VQWRVILVAALLAVNACASAFHQAPASQERRWKTYLGSSQRASDAADTLAADPAPIWRTDVGRGVVGAPALTEDLVVLSQVDRQLAVLDRRTGALIWRRRFGENIGSGPLVDYDHVFFATQTDQGQVVAVDLATGKKRWAVRLGDVAAPLAILDAQLYAGTVGGLIAALSTVDGGRVWRTQLSGAVRAVPVAVAGGVIVATAADSLYLLTRDNGAIRVRRGTQGTVLAAPALADSLLVFGTTGGRVEACDTATLATRWSLDVGSEVIGAIAVQGDTAFVLTHDGDLWWVPLDAPSHATHTALGVVARGGPTPVAGGVLVASVTGQLALVDARGARRWTAQIKPPVVQPVTVDGRFFVAVSERGEVVGFQ
jgi:outer membrane protein assembly factor BamB